MHCGLPKIYYLKNTFGYNGYIIPYVGVIINEAQKGNINLIDHELVHWSQFRTMGIFRFALKYFYHAIVSGYDLNPLEIEARYNENNFAKYNYTYAVRNGLSKTVYNPNFRK